MAKQRCPTKRLSEFWKKVVNPSRKDWVARLNDALWAYRKANKILLGMSPYKLVYQKNCHLSIELKKKTFWVIKELKLDPEIAKKERLFQLQELEEFSFMAYKNMKLYKEKSKLWHDAKI